ncbi:MAG: aldo/keto reductase [Clostridia bacterium]|nr:aldo/keto reductase [Clostridia bacterium]
MKKMQIGMTGIEVPAVAVGCMRLDGVDRKKGEALLRGALDMGLNFFDHADFYGYWKNYVGICEELFAEYLPMTPALREKIVIQTKCGVKIGPDGKGGMMNISYDFSKDYILRCVEDSLKRLKTDYIDGLLLHIPDALVEPEEVAEAFDLLEEQGKVRYFGVSNHTPMQIELLKKYVKQPICVNQQKLSLGYAPIISSGEYVCMPDERALSYDMESLNYGRLNSITMQCWSPFHGAKGGIILNEEKYPELNAVLEQMAEKYGTSKTAICIAWLLRHPAKLQPVTGTMDIQHLKESADGMDITLEHDDWYKLWIAAGNNTRA